MTTDQRTGAVLARIIKCRIADLDVYSPRTCLDWRISVNLEMNYEGDIGELSLPADPNSLVGAGAGAPRGGARSKDRMSYRHLAYQIDLTQVATTEVCHVLFYFKGRVSKFHFAFSYFHIRPQHLSISIGFIFGD